MPHVLIWTELALLAFLASIVSGVAGFGGGLLFLPFLVGSFGPRTAVPILTVSVLVGNSARVYFHRQHLNWKVVGLFSLGSIPFAVLGSVAYASLPGFWIKKGVGLFLLASVLYQWLYKPLRVRNPWTFTPFGAVSGFLSALVGGIGPLTAPLFLAYGFTKGAFVATDAMCAIGMHLAKSVSYNRLAILGGRELSAGLLLGVVMSGGSYVAKKILDRLPQDTFLRLVDALLVGVGIYMMLQTSP